MTTRTHHNISGNKDKEAERIAKSETLIEVLNKTISIKEVEIADKNNEISEKNDQIKVLERSLNKLQLNCKSLQEDNRVKQAEIEEKARLLEGQRKIVLDERMDHNKTKTELAETLKKLDMAKTHVAGISSHESLVNPTDVSVAFPNMKSHIKTYVEEIHKSILKNPAENTKKAEEAKALTPEATAVIELLTPIIDPKGLSRGKALAKHVFMGVLSRVLFLNFEFPSFFAGEDTCTNVRDHTRESNARAYLALSKQSPYEARVNKEYVRWYDNMLERLETALRPFLGKCSLNFTTNFVTESFTQVAKSVFALHCLCFSFYPRPDLIIRQSGSQNLLLCEDWTVFYQRADPDASMPGTTVAFMLIPGLGFEQTNLGAIIYCV